MPDYVADYLRTLNMSDRARAAAWDAAYAPDDAEAEQRLRSLPGLSDAVRADLWELRRGGTLEGEVKDFAPARAEDYIPQQGQEGSAAGRFLSNAGEMLNPINIVSGLYQAARHPLDTAGALLSAQGEQFSKAGQAYGEGRISEAVGHGAAGLLPVVGPIAAEAGEQIGSGDVAGGLGKATGILTPIVGARPAAAAARGAVRAVPRVRDAVAARLESGAASRVADVMSPKVGRQKVRIGNKAEKIAPDMAKDLAKDGAPFTRDAFHAQVQTKHQAAKSALDEAADARLAARSFETQPMIDALLEKRRAFTAEADIGTRVPRGQRARTSPIVDERGQPIQVAEPVSKPIGTDVVPGPNQARVAQIDQAIEELRTLGPTTTYEPIRRIRQAYDGPAEVVYNPAVTQDFMTARGRQLGAADVAGVLREQLAQWDPATATANAQYSLYRSADDALKAVAEIERTRPRVGRAIMARLTGTLIGGQGGGVPGAVAGYVGAPIVESALASGATTQLKTAAIMQRMADAIRSGQVEQVNQLAAMLDQVKRSASVTGLVQAERTTSPNGSQNLNTAPVTP